jgi:hypothetical protein
MEVCIQEMLDLADKESWMLSRSALRKTTGNGVEQLRDNNLET